MDIPEFNTRKELFDFLVKNKETLIAQKRAQIKHSDSLILPPTIIMVKNGVNKDMPEDMDPNIKNVMVKVVINTTNLMDSHKDVHMPGLWTKSIRENKNIMHIQEHDMCFENIIASGKDLSIYTKMFSFAELGVNLPGNTEALIFESLIKADRNPFMCDQYRKGYVTNHSVGMQYVKLIMCVNDENYGAEYEAWQKYYPEVANKDFADEYGYMWVVKEAKIVEGSAVVIGSNYVTPTIEVTEQKQEPLQSTQKNIEPAKPLIDFPYLINGVKNLKL
jgi:hypothetical protein